MTHSHHRKQKKIETKADLSIAKQIISAVNKVDIERIVHLLRALTGYVKAELTDELMKKYDENIEKQQKSRSEFVGNEIWKFWHDLVLDQENSTAFRLLKLIEEGMKPRKAGEPADATVNSLILIINLVIYAKDELFRYLVKFINIAKNINDSDKKFLVETINDFRKSAKEQQTKDEAEAKKAAQEAAKKAAAEKKQQDINKQKALEEANKEREAQERQNNGTQSAGKRKRTDADRKENEPDSLMRRIDSIVPSAPPLSDQVRDVHGHPAVDPLTGTGTRRSGPERTIGKKTRPVRNLHSVNASMQSRASASPRADQLAQNSNIMTNTQAQQVGLHHAHSLFV